MYGHGNYAQLGQGSQQPMPNFQQCPIPPPNPPFQHGPPASRYVIQQGPPSIPPHFTHAPPPPVQQGPPVQVPTSGMLHSGQSFLPLPPPQQVGGSTSMAHPYPVDQQKSQWTHHSHHTSLSVPPLGPSSSGTSRPEMFQPSLLPGALPTLPSRGQALFRVPFCLPQRGGMLVGQQSLPPPPPNSSFFSPAPFGSRLHSSHQESDVPAAGPMPPLLPPSSPPPLPPSPPPPTSSSLHTFGTMSSAPLPTVADLSHISNSGPMDNHSALEVMHSDSIVAVSSQIREHAPLLDDYELPEGTGSHEIVEEDLSSVECSRSVLLSTPPKPADQKVVQKIKVLCNFIAKNGPEFEDMARKKECGNPEFKFLFGGDPGSEAAVAHEYFEWMKKKFRWECELQEKHNNLVWRPSGIDNSTQTSYFGGTGVSHSPPDSDMDIEDDITPPDEEQQMCTSFQSINHETGLILEELDIREQLHALVNANKYSLLNDVSASSGLAGQEEGCKLVSDHDQFIDGRSLAKVDSAVMNLYGAAECPSKSKEEESSVSPLKDLSQQNKSAAAVSIGSGELPCELIKGASPFRLLQGYISDDSLEGDDEPRSEDRSPLKASPSTASAFSSLHRVAESNSGMRSDVAYGMSESNVACSRSMPINAPEFCPESQRTRTEISIKPFATVITEETFKNNGGDEGNTDNAASLEALQQSVVLDGVNESSPERWKSQSQREDVKSASTLRKVDEYGRLVREGARESDSDESHDTGRRGRRQKSRSRSPSPHGRQRRSPWRRREKRSRSRSLSPKKRRSRSRSPTYKRRGEYGGEKIRRDKGQLPMCFDFLRGRCHRGATCRYMHHDSGKSEGSRHSKSKQQYVEIPHVSRASGLHEENKKALSKGPVYEKELDGRGDGEKELVSMQDALPSNFHDQDDKSLVEKKPKSEMSQDTTASMHESLNIKGEKLGSTTSLPENCLGELTTIVREKQDIREQNLESTTGLHDVKSHVKQVETSHHIGSSASHYLQVQSSTSCQHGISEPQIKNIPPVQSYPSTSSVTHSVSSESLPPTHVNIPDHGLQLPTSLALLSQGTSTLTPTPHMLREHDLMQTASKLPYVQGPLQNLYSHSVPPPNSGWNLRAPPLPLPPPPPFVNNTNPNALQGFPSLQFQRFQLPSRSDFNLQTFVRPYSQGPVFVGEDHISLLPVQGINPPNLYGQSSIPSQPTPPLRTMQAFAGDNLPSGGFFTLSSQNHPYSQQQQPLHGLWQSPTQNLAVNQGDHGNVIPTMSRFASSVEKNQPSHPSDSGDSRISKYCNPHASTFDQPLSSNFSSNVIKQEKDVLFTTQHGSKFSSNVKLESDLLHCNQHGVGSIGSELRTSPPKPEPDDLRSDQYDPLFDSIDPFSNSFLKFEDGLKHEPVDDSSSLRLKGSHKPLDAEEMKHKERVLAETASIKSENDENGETADAEVGDVENASGSNALDATNTSAGEVEINQVMTPGKRNKSKDSRSTKLFKAAIADFVKEMLKPSWRQGNMSKEAFKTIVKKTVDKVSAAMKSHQIPKSQAKIDQYIDSSQRKLTKLVMGYVQKYVKV